jgi:predicted nucleotidyltransferase component of viral defense system
MFEHAISDRLFLLIQRLSGIAEISDTFYLAGGTALALHSGHRQSNDLDFFSEKGFNTERYAQIVLMLDGTIIEEEAGTLHAVIDNTKVSFLHYPYGLLEPFVQLSGIKLASIEDIGCMKVIAISQRGEKKDFYDMYEILKLFSPVEIKEMVLNKYKEQRINCYHILKSFFYFDEAEKSLDPISLNGTKWVDIKEYFLKNEVDLTKGLLC